MSGRRSKSVSGGVDGVLVVDKPAGMTSHDAVQVVRRAAGQRRVGHTGTLDPDATGVLVVCLGRATRLVQYLQAGRKTYAAALVLGVETTTQDASGDVVAETSAAGVDEETFCAVLRQFVGAIDQLPPMVSALKVGGERLHAKARRGEVVARAARRVHVYDLVLEDFEAGERASARFLVTCSAGTYVRTLAHDIGRQLGVGASLRSLQRLANGPFTLDDAVPLAEVRELDATALADRVLTLRSAAMRALPAVEMGDAATVRALANGKPMPAQGIEGPYAVVSADALVGVYADRDGQARPLAVLLPPSAVPPDVTP